MKPRFAEIDYLRGLAMGAMIMIHTNSYFLSDKIAFIVWDYLQCAVPVFILCSSYIYFQKFLRHPELDSGSHEIADQVRNDEVRSGMTKEDSSPDSIGFRMTKGIAYLKKRFLRLLIPYYIFAFVFIFVVWLKSPGKISLPYILQSFTLTGGIDINWLVVLFLQLTFVLPLVGWSYAKKPLIFWSVLGISLLSSLLFVFYHLPAYNEYKWIMWLPWTTIIVYTLFLVRFHTKKIFYIYSLLGGGVVFLFLRWIEVSMKHSLVLYDNKYPPNLYFLAYGIFCLALLHFLAKTRVFSFPGIKQVLVFLSRYSYELFFVHYIVLYLCGFLVWQYKFTWIEFFLSVFGISLLVQYCIVYVSKGRVSWV